MSREPNRMDHEIHSRRDADYGVRQATILVEFGDGKFGWVELGMCKTCGFVMLARCTHRELLWNEKGSLLTCDLCGVDYTHSLG